MLDYVRIDMAEMGGRICGWCQRRLSRDVAYYKEERARPKKIHHLLWQANKRISIGNVLYIILRTLMNLTFPFIMLLVDVVLLSGFLYVSFLNRNLPFAGRVKILRTMLLVSLLGLFAIPFPAAAPYLLEAIALMNSGCILVAVYLLWRKRSPKARRYDASWLEGYVQRLELELVERRSIEKELAFMAAVAERDPNCVVEMDAEGAIGYRNPATDTAFPDLETLGPKHPILAGLQEVREILKRDGKTHLRRPLRYDDHVYEQHVTWSPEGHKLRLYMTDVTEWKRLDQLKTDLLNTVSHEFRSPLAGILGSISMVTNGLVGAVTEEQRQVLGIVNSSATRLNRLINDLLDISKIEAGLFGLHPAEIDLAELVENVALSFAPVGRERNIDVKARLPIRPLMALVDGDKITQVLTNLTNNALKFTEKGRIEISLDAKEDEILCVVEDTGLGIPPEQMHRVFGKFQQLGSSVRGEKGTGLGLSLCKSLVELHKGKIGVDSQPGRGSRFYFTLPRLTAQSVFDDSLQQLYEQAAVAGRCLSAFILHLEEAPGVSAWTGKVELAKKLEAMVWKHLRTESDVALREGSKVYALIESLNKAETKTLIEKIIADLIPVATEAGALDRVVVRAQYTSLPDDGTTLEGLKERLTTKP